MACSWSVARVPRTFSSAARDYSSSHRFSRRPQLMASTVSDRVAVRRGHATRRRVSERGPERRVRLRAGLDDRHARAPSESESIRRNCRRLLRFFHQHDEQVVRRWLTGRCCVHVPTEQQRQLGADSKDGAGGACRWVWHGSGHRSGHDSGRRRLRLSAGSLALH